MPESGRARLEMLAVRLAAELAIVSRDHKAIYNLPANVPGGGSWRSIEWEMPRRTCPECGGENVRQNKTINQGGSTARRCVCGDCGEPFRVTVRILSEEQRQKLAVDMVGQD